MQRVAHVEMTDILLDAGVRLAQGRGQGAGDRVMAARGRPAPRTRDSMVAPAVEGIGYAAERAAAARRLDRVRRAHQGQGQTHADEETEAGGRRDAPTGQRSGMNSSLCLPPAARIGPAPAIPLSFRLGFALGHAVTRAHCGVATTDG
jgi:hypothetical protein